MNQILMVVALLVTTLTLGTTISYAQNETTVKPGDLPQGWQPTENPEQRCIGCVTPSGDEQGPTDNQSLAEFPLPASKAYARTEGEFL